MHSADAAHLRLIGADAVVGESFSAGNSGRVDDEGYLFLVARKNICWSYEPCPAPECKSRQAIVSGDIGRGWTLLPGT
jgi:hypothetical protein